MKNERFRWMGKQNAYATIHDQQYLEIVRLKEENKKYRELLLSLGVDLGESSTEQPKTANAQ